MAKKYITKNPDALNYIMSLRLENKSVRQIEKELDKRYNIRISYATLYRIVSSIDKKLAEVDIYTRCFDYHKLKGIKV